MKKDSLQGRSINLLCAYAQVEQLTIAKIIGDIIFHVLACHGQPTTATVTFSDDEARHRFSSRL